MDRQVREGNGRAEWERTSQYRARAYHPGLGRFMSEDPKLFVRRAGLGKASDDWSFAAHPDEAEFNLFRYCGNDPIDFTDPMGEFVDVLADIGFIAYDVYKLATDSSNRGENWRALGLDVAAAAVPFATGAGAVYRGAKGLERAAEARKGLHRSYTRKATREAAEARAAKTAGGKFIDPNTGKVIEGKYDLGHKPGHEFRTEKARAEAEGIGQKQFNNRMNDPQKLQVEDPSSNRSHRFEQKDPPSRHIPQPHSE